MSLLLLLEGGFEKNRLELTTIQSLQLSDRKERDWNSWYKPNERNITDVKLVDPTILGNSKLEESPYRFKVTVINVC